jgi:hypothetical protein
VRGLYATRQWLVCPAMTGVHDAFKKTERNVSIINNNKKKRPKSVMENLKSREKNAVPYTRTIIIFRFHVEIKIIYLRYVYQIQIPLVYRLVSVHSILPYPLILNAFRNVPILLRPMEFSKIAFPMVETVLNTGLGCTFLYFCLIKKYFFVIDMYSLIITSHQKNAWWLCPFFN